MSLPWPKEWSGSNPLAAWVNRLLKRCQQEQLLESKDFRKVPTVGGYYLEPKFSTGGSKGKTTDANYKLMIITKLGSSLTPPAPDLLICKAYDWNSQAVTGAEVYVAKDSEARQIAKEFYPDNSENVTVSYTYFTPTQADPSYGDNFRLANDGTNTELQVMDKRYITKDQLVAAITPLTQAIVWVIDTSVPTGVKDPTGANVTRIEVKPSRLWVRYATQ